MWKVGREWLPRRVRLRRERELPDGDVSWLADLFDVDFSAGAIVAAISIAVVGAFLFLIVWPIVALALELVILVLLFLASLAGRVVLRRPWRVVARTKDPGHAALAWDVKGWRESGRVIEEVAHALESGQKRPQPAGAQRTLLE
jgi:hypothetical protein